MQSAGLRRKLSVFAAGMMVCSQLMLPSVSVLAAQDTTTPKEALRLRLLPSTEADILTTLYPGDEVTLIRQQDDWYQVGAKGQVGYVRSEYLSALPMATAQAASISSDIPCGVTTARVNLRALPTTSSQSERLLAVGTRVQLLSREYGWYKVRSEGRTGYIRADLVQVITALDKSADADFQTQAKGMSDGESDSISIRLGDRNEYVVVLQKQLEALGYLKAVDGVFGEITQAAVHQFQSNNGLYADGVVGQKTLDKLYDNPVAATAVVTKAVASVKPVTVDKSSVPENIPAMPSASSVTLTGWAEVNKLWKNGETAWIFDIQTGKSYRLRRFAGANHADVEPLTSWDTKQLLDIFGSQTWTPRPIIVLLPNGQAIAASTHSKAHSVKSISGNNFNGHLCVHFLNSKTHNGNASYTAQHQKTVKQAWSLLGN